MYRPGPEKRFRQGKNIWASWAHPNWSQRSDCDCEAERVVGGLQDYWRDPQHLNGMWGDGPANETET